MNDTVSPSKCFTRTIDLDLESLASLTKEMETFGSTAGIPDNVMMQLSLVVEEIITNAMKYGYSSGQRRHAEVTVMLSPGMVRLEIGDDGNPFNPAWAPVPDIHSPIKKRSIGGLGLHLIRQLMDSFEYERKNDRNLVTVKKRF